MTQDCIHGSDPEDLLSHVTYGAVALGYLVCLHVG